MGDPLRRDKSAKITSLVAPYAIPLIGKVSTPSIPRFMNLALQGVELSVDRGNHRTSIELSCPHLSVQALLAQGKTKAK